MSRLRKSLKGKDAPKNFEGSISNGIFKIDNYSTKEIMDFVIDEGLDDEDDLLGDVNNELIINALCIVILVQLRYSITEDAKYYDQLPSIKYYKKKILSAEPGLTWCTLISALECINYIDLSLLEIAQTFIIKPISPSKKVGGKPTKGNATEWFLHRRSVILGTIQSCPSTKASAFGLNSSCANWTTDDALNFIWPNGLPENVTKQNIISDFKDYLLTGTNDTTMSKITFKEPNLIKSKIEEEIFSDIIVRNGETSTKVLESGILPDNRVTKDQLEKFLNSKELRQYRVALKFGDNQVLKELNTIASKRIKDASTLEE